MNPREKRLVFAVGGILAAILLAAALRVAFTKPLKEIDKKTAVIRGKLEKVNSERRAYFAAEDVVKQCVQRSFSEDLDEASAKSGEMLTKQIVLSGLREVSFSRLPVGPRKLRGANEIGWSVQGQGKLEDVVDLVFLLQESPYIHRIENITISAGEQPGHVRIGFRFLTLVVDAAPVVETISLENKVSLDGPERRIYDGIAARDLLRPYIQRAPAKSAAPEAAPATSTGPSSLRVVSLSEWMGESEVHVRDLKSERTVRYKIGDELAEGKIAMVDYRPLPLPGNDGLKSFSRVILKIEDEYWAIERGQTLAEKRRLTPEELPEMAPKL